MKVIHFSLIFFIIVVGCVKESENIKTDIQLELSDDVSPVYGKFSINQRVQFSEWKINNETVFGNTEYPENYELAYLFKNGGVYNVSVNADIYNSQDKLTGSKQFIIPDFANKLKISGINLNNHNFNFTDNNIRIEFYYYNGINLYYFERIVPTLEINNKINIESNLILQIINVYQSDQNHYLDINIIGEESAIRYFKGRLGLYTNYHYERLNENPKLGRISGWNNEGDLFIELDWYKD